MNKKLPIFLFLILIAFSSKAQILEENFESGSSIFTLNEDWVENTEFYKNGTKSIKNIHDDANTTYILELTNSIDLSATETPVLSFWQIAKTEGTYDKCYVEISSDGGANYETLIASHYLGENADFIENGYFHEDSYEEWGTYDSDPIDNTMWKKESFSLVDFKENNVKIRFRSTTDYSGYRQGWFLDDILIENVSCFYPTTIETSSILDTSVTLSWNDSGATSYVVEYGVSGFTLGTGTQITTNETLKIIEGLSGSTDYDFYVKSICSDSEESDFSNNVSIRTLCSILYPENLPWSNGFEDIPVIGSGKVGECMEEIGSWYSAGQDLSFGRTARNGENYVYTSYTSDDWLLTPYLNLEENKTYRFSFWYTTDGTGSWDISIKKGENDDPTTWTETIYSNEENASEYTKIEGEFTITNDVNFRLGIHVEADNSPWYFSVDDLLIEEITTDVVCELPTAISVQEITQTTAKVSWENTTNVEIIYGEAGFDITSDGTTISATGNEKVIENLNANTSYDIYVKNVCSDSNKSDWTTVENFSTLEEVIVTCELPTAISIQEITQTTAKISWENTTNVEIIYGEAGFDITSEGTTISATGNEKVIENLIANTSYDIYVKNVCSDSNKSDWTIVENFSTLEEVIVTCEKPEDIEIEDIETTTAKVKWDSEIENTEILYGETGFDITSEGTNFIVLEDDDYELENLSSNTTYDVYLRTICSDSSKSEWTIKTSFTTKENLSVSTFEKELISIYPNPAKETIYIKSAISIKNIEVVNSLGKIVIQKKNHIEKLQVNNLNPGIYFINIYTEKGTNSFKLHKM
ncbi:T9SS type A sorting domain-containing protein [Aureivirga marina]|uniref:T9SS type A sorting domain-containing protein n=1 Tax=Aureivirga marina TaxID=1182451 RepID=UPI0018CA3C9B|nr:T9SS type A sorting domain-containing protein [Aureivirga marina]